MTARVGPGGGTFRERSLTWGGPRGKRTQGAGSSSVDTGIVLGVNDSINTQGYR